MIAAQSDLFSTAAQPVPEVASAVALLVFVIGFIIWRVRRR